MAERGRRCLFLLWNIIWPLLLYETVCQLVRMEAGLLFPEKKPEILMLPAMGIGAFITSLILGKIYLEKRYLAGKRGSRCPASLLFWSGAAGVGSCLFLNSLIMLFPSMGTEWEQVSVTIYGLPFCMQILCTGLVIPFAEELLFRGMGYWQLRQEFPLVWAAFLSALWFALFHGNLVQGLYAFAAGVLLAVLFEWTDSLWVVWIYHSSANMISVCLQELGEKGILPQADLGCFPEGRDLAVQMFTVAAGSLILILSLSRIKRKIREG